MSPVQQPRNPERAWRGPGPEIGAGQRLPHRDVYFSDRHSSGCYFEINKDKISLT
jgi:hypothetical protein